MAESAAALEGINGQRFGRLTAVEYVSTFKVTGVRLWRFLCKCGESRVIDLGRVRNGTIRSCGCLEIDRVKASKVKTSVNGFADQHSTYEARTVALQASESETSFSLETVNCRPSVIDGWLFDDHTMWSHWHVRVIDRCRDMWMDMDRPSNAKFVASYFDRRDAATHTAAMRKLRFLARQFPRWKWEIFENVVRWNQPTGILGSSLSTPSAASVAAAKAIVLGVSQQLSEGFL